MALDPITAGLNLASAVLDRISPDQTKKLEFQQKLTELQLSGELQRMTAEFDVAKQQIAVNAEEAKSTSIFVAGWRPFIGWVCGSVFAYLYLVQPVIVFILACQGVEIKLPVFDMDSLMYVMGTLLGFGGLRTWEKHKGWTK